MTLRQAPEWKCGSMGWKKSCEDVRKMFKVDVSVNWRYDPNSKNKGGEKNGTNDSGRAV